MEAQTPSDASGMSVLYGAMNPQDSVASVATSSSTPEVHSSTSNARRISFDEEPDYSDGDSEMERWEEMMKKEKIESEEEVVKEKKGSGEDNFRWVFLLFISSFLPHFPYNFTIIILIWIFQITRQEMCSYLDSTTWRYANKD